MPELLVITALLFAVVEAILSPLAVRWEKARLPAPLRYTLGVGMTLAMYGIDCYARGRLVELAHIAAFFIAAGVPVLLTWWFSPHQPVEEWPGMTRKRITHEAIRLIENTMAARVVLDECLHDASQASQNMKHYQELLRYMRKEDE